MWEVLSVPQPPYPVFTSALQDASIVLIAACAVLSDATGSVCLAPRSQLTLYPASPGVCCNNLHLWWPQRGADYNHMAYVMAARSTAQSATRPSTTGDEQSKCHTGSKTINPWIYPISWLLPWSKRTVACLCVAAVSWLRPSELWLPRLNSPCCRELTKWLQIIRHRAGTEGSKYAANYY